MYGRIITVTGWTWEYVRDELDMAQLRKLFRYWNEHPPQHELLMPIAQFVGATKAKDAPAPAQRRTDGLRSEVPPHMRPSGPIEQKGPEQVGPPLANMQQFGMTIGKNKRRQFNPISFDWEKQAK